MLAILYADAYTERLPEVERPLECALDAARQALTIDPLCQYAHYAMAYALFFRREFETLKRQVRSLRQTSEMTEQAVLQTQKEVAVTRQEAGRAEVDARQARELAEQTQDSLAKEPTLTTRPDKYKVSIGGNLNR